MANPKRPLIQAHTHEYFDLANAQKLIAKRKKERTELNTLYKDAAGQGYTPLVGPKDVFAIRETYRAAEPIKNPSGPGAVQGLEVEFSAQNLGGPRSRDKWAIASVSLKSLKPDGSDGPAEVYDMRLVAPLGDIQRSQEFIVVSGKVKLTHSWWSRTKKCLLKNCVATCTAALLGCSGTWAVYLACVAAACGGCFTYCSACATCKCKWYCKWATGCCKK